MSYRLTQQGDDVTYNVRSCVVNSESDIATLPTDWESGSSALVIETSTVFMLSVPDDITGEKHWVEI